MYMKWRKKPIWRLKYTVRNRKQWRLARGEGIDQVSPPTRFRIGPLQATPGIPTIREQRETRGDQHPQDSHNKAQKEIFGTVRKSAGSVKSQVTDLMNAHLKSSSKKEHDRVNLQHLCSRRKSNGLVQTMKNNLLCLFTSTDDRQRRTAIRERHAQ
jgi:hypothetical protein